LKKIRVLSSSSSSSKKHKSKHKSKNGSIGEPSTYAGLPLTAIREIKILKQLKHPNMVRMLEVVTSKGVEELDDDSMGEEKEEQQQNAADKSSDPDLSDKDNNSDDYLKDDLKHLRYVGNLFLVLEYVPMDLTGLMDMGYRFTHVQAKCLFRQLLQVLEYIHENKYVHRDLKCSNILVDWDFRLKLADFGLARSIRYEPIYKNNPDAVGMSMSEYNAFMSQAGAIFMPPVASGNSNQNPKYTNKVITLWYRPPELLMGERQYGTGVDMWSAGCILAELILGRPILPGKSEMQQLDLIFELIGSPTEPKNNWDVSSLPSVKSKKVDVYEGNPGNLRTRFHERKIPKSAMDLIEKLLTLDPRKRISARGSLLSRYFIMEPKAPEDPSELGKIQIDGKTEKDNFHEFQTKKARKEAKVVAEAARKEAVKLGLSKSEIDDRYHESYRKHMSVAKLNKEPPKVRSPKLGKRPEETKDVSKNSKISETEKGEFHYILTKNILYIYLFQGYSSCLRTQILLALTSHHPKNRHATNVITDMMMNTKTIDLLMNPAHRVGMTIMVTTIAIIEKNVRVLALMMIEIVVRRKRIPQTRRRNARNVRSIEVNHENGIQDVVDHAVSAHKGECLVINITDTVVILIETAAAVLREDFVKIIGMIVDEAGVLLLL